MTLVMLVIHTLIHAVGLLLDMLALLILVRALCGWRSVPVLAEFNEAGRPLVDRTLQGVARLWRRFVPKRPLSSTRLLIVAWLAVTALRLSGAALLGMAAHGS